MSSPWSLITLMGAVLMVVGIWGLLTGKVMAGSKGFATLYYQKSSQPVLYYFFIILYLSVGMLAIWHART